MRSMSRPEFIALIAMMFATIAFSVDAMLPALPQIGLELSPDNVNRAQLILISFMVGMGAGTFIVGPLSDSFGRKPVILVGSAIYIAASAACLFVESIELLLVARLMQGLGASGPRVVSLAIMRDLYSGRIMARMMSIAMMIFTLFPAFAPLIGTGIIAVLGWRGIFLAFIVFSLIASTWMATRLPETLPKPNRRPFRPRLMISALHEMVTHPTVRLSIIVQSLCMGMLITMLTMVQQIYDLVFDRADVFPFWFAASALVAGLASLLNATIVVRIGMRRIVTWVLFLQVVLAAGMAVASELTLPHSTFFALFVAWQATLNFGVGTTLGNLNAIAMEPMGHIAGMAASVIGALSTILAACIATPVGQLFNGTIQPMAFGILTMAGAGYLLMLRMKRVEEMQAV